MNKNKPFFFFYLGFLSRTFTIHRTAGEGRSYLFNSCLPLPLALQILRHQPNDYSRELTSAHNWQPDSNQEPLVFEFTPLTTKLRVRRIVRRLKLNLLAYLKLVLRKLLHLLLKRTQNISERFSASDSFAMSTSLGGIWASAITLLIFKRFVDFNTLPVVTSAKENRSIEQA